MIRALLLAFTVLGATVPAVADDTRPASVHLTANAVGTLHLSARLGQSVPSEFLLDTGSAYVVLSEEARRRLQAEGALTELRQLRAVLANNATVKAKVYRVASLELVPGCIVRDFEAVALPGARKNILGLSALRAVAPFTVSLAPDSLEVTCHTDAGLADVSQVAREQFAAR